MATAVKTADKDQGFPSCDWFKPDFLLANMANMMHLVSKMYAS